MNKHVMAFLKDEIAAVLNKSPDDIDEQANILKLGISSIQVLKIINRVRKKFDVDIDPVVLFEYKTIAAFARYLGTASSQSD